jgi:hypothetical protein
LAGKRSKVMVSGETKQKSSNDTSTQNESEERFSGSPCQTPSAFISAPFWRWVVPIFVSALATAFLFQPQRGLFVREDAWLTPNVAAYAFCTFFFWVLMAPIWSFLRRLLFVICANNAVGAICLAIYWALGIKSLAAEMALIALSLVPSVVLIMIPLLLYPERRRRFLYIIAMNIVAAVTGTIVAAIKGMYEDAYLGGNDYFRAAMIAGAIAAGVSVLFFAWWKPTISHRTNKNVRFDIDLQDQFCKLV